MKVRKSTDSRRKLVRYMVDAVTEHRNGDLPKRFYRTDADGKPFAKQKDAEKYIRELMDNMRTGTNPEDVRGKTFGDAFDLYIEHLETSEANGQGSPYHYDIVKSRLRRHVKALTLRDVKICNVRLSTIDEKLIKSDLLPQLRDDKFTQNQRSILLTDVRKIFDFALKANWMNSNPAKDVTVGTVVTKSRERSGNDPLALEVYQRLKDSLSLHLEWARRLDPEAALPIEIAAMTGVRAGELCALMPAKIGHNTRELKVDKAWKKIESGQPKVLGPTKTHEARVVGLPANLISLLSRHQQDNEISQDALLFGATDHAPWRRAWQRAQFAVAGWFLLYSGSTSKAYRLFKLTGNETDADLDKLRSWSDGQIGKAQHCKRDDGIVFKTLAEAAAHTGVVLLTWHDLRHLYCSVLFFNNLDIGRITALMGHKDDRTTRNNYKEWISNPDLTAAEADGVNAAYG